MRNKQQISKEVNILKDGYILDYATSKPVDIRKQEEKVRQKYERELCENYHYSKEQIDIEVQIQRGSKKNEKADIVIYKTPDPTKRSQHKDILCIVETKRSHLKEGVKQLMSYMSATSAIFGIWTNGEDIERIYIYKDPKTGELKQHYIYQIPKCGENINDLDRITKDKLEPAKNLKNIFRRIHRTLYSNTNISRKEKLGSELMRLIFCKIHDELYNSTDIPKFKVGIGEKPKNVKNRIVEIWNEVRQNLVEDGIFEEHEKNSNRP